MLFKERTEFKKEILENIRYTEIHRSPFPMESGFYAILIHQEKNVKKTLKKQMRD